MVSVRLEGVTKTFGDVLAVDDVSVEIGKGELFFLLGPSGCGKTTVLRMIAGFYRPNRGNIYFEKRDISGVPPHRRNTGMVFQNYALWPHMTVWENVSYGLDVRKTPEAERDDRVRKSLEIVKMIKYGDRNPNQLSGGQQQRVALARALVIEPDVVLLDEPLSNLDAKLRIEMREEVKRIHDEVGTTMIYVTHDQKEALSMAQNMAVMNEGHIEQVGTPRAIYNRPANRFVADFIGETNFIGGKIVEIGDLCVVETPIGRILSSFVSGDLVVGNEVMCSVRPESVELLDTNGEIPNSFPAVVKRVTYLGDSEQYILELRDGSLAKVVRYNPREKTLGIRAELRIFFQAGDVVVLPSE